MILASAPRHEREIVLANTDYPLGCSIQIASILLQRNKRTLQRWCEDGSLRVVSGGVGPGQRQLVDLTQVLTMFGPCTEPNFSTLIAAADKGFAEAQTDLAIVLLQEGKPEIAAPFLNEAAKQGLADAMHLLFHCHIEGLGVKRDTELAMRWLHEAAATGHVIAKAQTQAMRALAARSLHSS